MGRVANAGTADTVAPGQPGGGLGRAVVPISRIKGAIIDERAIDWIPRSVRFKAREARRPTSPWRTACIAAPPTPRLASSLYYYEGLTLAEIGQVLGVTESRVCQMHTKAVLQLRAKMQDAR